MTEVPDGFTLVYWNEKAGHSHIIDDVSGSAGDDTATLCGLDGPMFSGWYGTGSHKEREHAAALLLCIHCLKALERIKGCS
jgi:hypothetical protein